MLGYRQAIFSERFLSLEKQYRKVHRAVSVHGRRVAHARRIGGAMVPFLVSWIYLGAIALLPDYAYPAWLASIAFGALCASSGWAGAEWWASNREMNRLSVLAREARQYSGGLTR